MNSSYAASTSSGPGTSAIVSVDDNPMMEDVVGMLVDQMPGYAHLKHFLSGAGVLDTIRRENVKLIILDYEIPGTDTLELLREIVANCPDSRVIMLSAHGRPDIVEACRRAGAAGYLLKDSQPSQIVKALQQVAAGGNSFMSARQALRSYWLRWIRALRDKRRFDLQALPTCG